MTTVNLNELELNEFVARKDSNQHCKATFPMLGSHGTQKSATVYIELAPGDKLGRHTDSAEELLLILEGNVEVTVGEEKRPASAGTLALVPEMVPHDIRNTGSSQARIIGFFGGANQIVATFDQVWLPTESNVVDTSKVS
jgi:quercetin dioxygenase-like cupin family protein